jgi:hypothetical protein
MIDDRVASGQAIRAHTRAARLERGVAAVAARRVQWRRWAVLLLCWQAVTWTLALVMTWLVGIEVLSFFVVVMGVASFPLFTRVLARPGWLLERQVRAGADVALAIGHLPVPVGRLAEETRVLRLAIEAANPGDPTALEWVWAWITTVREVGAETREVLDRLGLAHDDVEKVLLADELRASSGKPEDSLRARVVAMRSPPDEAVERRRLELIAEHLEAFEVALLRYDPSPYR